MIVTIPWLAFCFISVEIVGFSRAEESTLSSDFESDYKALTTGIETFQLGPGTSYEISKLVHILGPNAFPVISNNQGSNFVAAGKFEKGKYLFIPNGKHFMMDSALPEYPEGQQLIQNTIQWMAGDKDNSTIFTDQKLLDGNLMTFKKKSALVNALKGDSRPDIVVVASPGKWTDEHVMVLQTYLEEGGNVMFTGTEGKRAFKQFLLHCGVYEASRSEAETINTSEVPSPSNVISNILQKAIDGNFPEEIDRYSIDIEVLSEFYAGPMMGIRQIIGIDLVKLPIYPYLQDTYLKSIEKFEVYDQHLPDFVSQFQAYFLPAILQNSDFDEKLLTPAPTHKDFPPKVDPDPSKYKSKTVLTSWKYPEDFCLNEECQGGKYSGYIKSTGLYAVPGKLVTITFPEEKMGTFEILINIHNDNVWHKKARERWQEGKENYAYRPGYISSFYSTDTYGFTNKINIVSPYGGGIYFKFKKEADLEATIEGAAIEVPTFVHGETTNEGFKTMLETMEAPMCEIEIPGKMILTVPTYQLKKYADTMEELGQGWHDAMVASEWMLGYKLPRPMRFVTDIEVAAGSAHSGYPMMGQRLKTIAFDIKNMKLGKMWGAWHEMGHNFDEPRYIPEGAGETVNNIFAVMINNKVFGKNYTNYFATGVSKFRDTERNLASLNLDVKMFFLNSYIGPYIDFGWDPFAATFQEYLDLPVDYPNPDTSENRFSMWAKFMCKHTGHNLIPYYQWWQWPITDEVIEETKHLPLWDMAGKLEDMTYACLPENYKNCCTEDHPCDLGDGDCDRHSHCKGDLKCGKNNCAPEKGFNDDADCCYQP